MFNVKVDLKGLREKADKIRAGGDVQRFFATTVTDESERYIPLRNGVLRDTARLNDSYTVLTYNTPYARYLWYGKLMVDPKTGKGAFYNPRTGRFWSRSGVTKVLTNRDLNFRGAPMRGPFWVQRMWADNGKDIIDALVKNWGAK